MFFYSFVVVSIVDVRCLFDVWSSKLCHENDQEQKQKQKHCIIFSVPFLHQHFILHFTFPRCLLNYWSSNGASRAPYKFLYDFIFIIFVVCFFPPFFHFFFFFRHLFFSLPNLVVSFILSAFGECTSVENVLQWKKHRPMLIVT